MSFKTIKVVLDLAEDQAMRLKALGKKKKCLLSWDCFAKLLFPGLRMFVSHSFSLPTDIFRFHTFI